MRYQMQHFLLHSQLKPTMAPPQNPELWRSQKKSSARRSFHSTYVVVEKILGSKTLNEADP